MTAQIKNVKLNISVFFAAAVTFMLIFAPDGSALTGLFCCIAHEAGHLVFIKLFGAKVSTVYFGVYGMRIETSGTLRLSHLKEAAVAFAGPALNIAFIIIGLIIKNSRFVNINAALALLNLMPVGKTDGRNILYNLLIRTQNVQKTEKALRMTGAVFLGIIYFFAFAVFIKSGYNFSLFAAAVYITALFLSG